MKFTHYISTVTLAIILLFSSTGLVVNKHYCGGELKSVSLQNNHASCGMCESVESTSTHHKTTENNNCCDNEQIQIDTQEYNTTVNKISLDKPFLLYTITFVEVTSNLFFTYNFNSSNKTYKPPSFLVKDIPIIIQSLLI
ncbi:MAG: hypothetical protein OEW67_00555 [Cyclobacteriaceae bacterium]|nr:hypothetical protein [Cyclobacteriaceae bacterium]